MLKNSVLIMGLLLPSMAQADESLFEQTMVRLLPQYAVCEVGEVRYACYTEEAQIILNTLEVNALEWHRKWRISENLRVALNESITNLSNRVLELSTIDDMQRTRIDNLVLQLEQEIELKNQYRLEAEDTDMLPLYVGAVVGILGVGLVAGVLLVTYVN